MLQPVTGVAMPVSPRTFWLPRRGYDPADYEDAFAANAVAGRFAVADGATEGCFTDLWARLLVDDFVAGSAREAACWPDGLPALQDRWAVGGLRQAAALVCRVQRKPSAFAAFLGLVLQSSPLPPGEGQGVRECCRWQAVAVGDSCLLHTRDSAPASRVPPGAG